MNIDGRGFLQAPPTCTKKCSCGADARTPYLHIQLYTRTYAEAKRELPPDSSAAAQGGEEKEDELPTVVVLRRGDVTAEEYQEFRRSRKDDGTYLQYLRPHTDVYIRYC